MLVQLAFTICAIAVLEGIAVYAWQFRAEPGARWHVWGHVCKGLWLAALSVAMLGENSFLGMAAGMATWLLSITSVYIWYRFFAELSGFDREAPRWLTPSILTGTVICWLLFLTNPWHHLIAHQVMVGGVIEGRLGRLCILTYTFAYSVNLLSIVLNVRWALRCRGLRRRQAWAFLLPSLLLWTGQFLSAMNSSSHYDPHAPFFLLSGLATAWAFFRWRSLSVFPRAQEAMLRSMIDALMVVDEQGYIVRLNAAARAIFPNAAKEGVHFESIARVCPALGHARESQALEVDWMVAGAKRCFLVNTTSLYAAPEHFLGQVLCFRDITHEKEQQARIVEQEKAISQLEERTRLGRELHDGLGQTWSYVSMQLCAIERRIELGEAARVAQLVSELRNAVQDTHIGLRETITALHTGGEALKHGLLAAIEEQLRWYREHCGWQASLELDCAWQEEMLAPQCKVQLLRIVQQSLANTRKHAQADKVRVSIDRDGNTLCFKIEDNGRGFDPEQADHRSGHHGLRMMRERAAEIGAVLHIRSRRGTGTRVTALLPIASFPPEAAQAPLVGEAP
jgi:signal transduction histidine kinase